MTWKMSEIGKDVRSANPTELTMDSNLNHLKGLIQVDLSKTLIGVEGDLSAGLTVLATFSHNLGYMPFYEATLSIDDGTNPAYKANRAWIAEGGLWHEPDYSHYTFYCDVTTTQIRLVAFRHNEGTGVNIPFGGWTFSAKVWVFADQAF